MQASFAQRELIPVQHEPHFVERQSLTDYHRSDKQIGEGGDVSQRMTVFGDVMSFAVLQGAHFVVVLVYSIVVLLHVYNV